MTNFKLISHISTLECFISRLNDEDFDVEDNTAFDWIHDTYLVPIRRFPGGCPPTVLLSPHGRSDSQHHMKGGSTLRSLRNKEHMFISTRGAVHNLPRNKWAPMLRFWYDFT